MKRLCLLALMLGLVCFFAGCSAQDSADPEAIISEPEKEVGDFLLTYDGNGHTYGSLPESVSLNYDEHVNIAEKGDLRGEEIRDGITRRFVAWNMSPDGTGEDLEPGSDFYMPDHDVTLYAQWNTGDDVLRNAGPAGGLVFIDRGPEYEEWRYMEAAPSETEWEDVDWGSHEVTIEGTSKEIGTGLANTEIIVSALEAAGESGHAAQLCYELQFNGFDDWFLPSSLELQEMAVELKSKEGNIGDFIYRNYWSSTASMGGFDTLADAYHFNMNALSPQQRDSKYWVRAVRVF